MFGLDGKSILVTGASGGIGSETVRQLIKAGAHVYASGRNEAKLQALADETGCTTLAFDLTDDAQVRDAVAGLPLWGVVNCGGYGGEIATPMATDMAVFDKAIAINTRSALLIIKYASKIMVERGEGGAIVNVSSQAALVGLDGHISYAASKAALDGITRVAALELGKYNIRVNSVNPTAVMTDMAVGYWGRPEIGEPFLKQMPLGRWAKVEEIAAPIVFLLGDGASMITGITVPIDGGFTSC